MAETPTITRLSAPKPKAKKVKKPDPKHGPVSLKLESEAHEPIPTAPKLLLRTLRLIRDNWKIMLGLALIYLVLNLLLVQGLSAASNLETAKSSLDAFGQGAANNVANGITLYTSLIGASGTNIAPTAGAYQFLLALIMTLAIIWSLRQIYAKRVINSIKDAFYYGMYPLIPFFFVLLVVLMHLLPFALGAVLYGIVMANGIATTFIEQSLFLLVFLGLGFLSLYLLCSSAFALYIVTLPEMTPMGALRSARDLVAYRRWSIMRKVIFLPFVLLVIGAIIMVPFILFATIAAPWIFAALVTLLIVVAHSYMYTLYRALL
ncbi:MAG TPA: hypothetical protein VLF62_01450 [Candidatus Saccharimonadales bacterium]|nr:hypothetical protein [Candidatus Saccharimonadales bacterium]